MNTPKEALQWLIVGVITLCALEVLTRFFRAGYEPDFFEDAVLAACCGTLLDLLFFI